MRETLVLNRLHTSDNGTFGELLRDGKRIAVTCELPWRENEHGKSCIPGGSYLCTPHNGTRFKNVWELNGVPDRSAILIHQGNTIKDTDGCILVGRAFGNVHGLEAVVESVVTLDKLRNDLPSAFMLKVSDVP